MDPGRGRLDRVVRVGRVDRVAMVVARVGALGSDADTAVETVSSNRNSSNRHSSHQHSSSPNNNKTHQGNRPNHVSQQVIDRCPPGQAEVEHTAVGSRGTGTAASHQVIDCARTAAQSTRDRQVVGIAGSAMVIISPMNVPSRKEAGDDLPSEGAGYSARRQV